MRRIAEFVKATLVGGLVFLVPVVLSVYIVGKALVFAKKVAEPVSSHLSLGTVVGVAAVDVIGLALIMLLCFFAGLLARSARARAVVDQAEHRFLWKIPAYGMVKGVTESISEADTKTFKPVLVRLDDASQIAFEIERLPDGRVVVFMPGAPDAWSGAVMIMTEDRVRPLSISVVAVVQNLRSRGRGTGALLAPSA